MEDISNTCFIIGPIGDPGTDIRKRSDQLFRHVLEPAANECGYKAIRADHISDPGIITIQVIQHILDAPIVIADLTGGNPNVFYELAIRHLIRKPYVQIIHAGERIPFDVAGLRTIEVDHRDLDIADIAKKEIIKQIKFTQKDGYEVASPISITLDYVLRRSESVEKKQLEDIIASVNELKSDVSLLKNEKSTLLVI